MSNIARDHITRFASMVTQRSQFDSMWQQVHQVAAPEASDFQLGPYLSNTATSGYILDPIAAKNSRKLYDSTAVWCVDRLASGIEALITPQSDYWHGLSLTDYTKEDETDEEKLYLERLRNLLFKARYDADTGFIRAVQTCIRRAVAFGNAFMMVEEGWDKRAMFRYFYVPLAEAYIAENSHYQVDTFKRMYGLTGRQALQKFGDRCSKDIKRAAESPTDQNRIFKFLQCIGPRADYGMPSAGVMHSPWYSLHIEYDKQLVVGESGFHEFPIIDFRWMPEPGRVYGEGPVMKCLADIQSLNQHAKNELIAGEQAVKPPLLVANAGVMNRPNSAPNAITYGGINAQGQRMVEPMFTGQRLDFATEVLKAKREQLKESMYINLFALLVQHPQMSASEAMIRANEKGELLGPAGAGFQSALSNMVERELGIMTRRGLFSKKQFAPPKSMERNNVGTQFSSPLDRARQGKEVEGTMHLLNIISPLAQIDPSIVDNLDGDVMVRGLAHRMGMPISFVRDENSRLAIRQQKAQAAQMQQQAAVAKDFASAGKQGVDALAGLQQMGGA